MDNSNETLVTVLTATYPNQLVVIRSRLESEGIECYLKNELVSQMRPFYSDEFGGVELQVKRSDVARAVKILKDGGYYTEADLRPPKTPAFLNKYTSKIPFIRKLRVDVRLFTLVALIVTLAVVIFYIVMLHTSKERLTESSWCLNFVEYNGKKYYPHTNQQLVLNTDYENCNETITFDKGGRIIMPGFNSNNATGSWEYENGRLKISGIDTFSYVYNGIYKINHTGNVLILKSITTTLNCKAQYLGY